MFNKLQVKPLSVTILGSNSAVPSLERNPTSQIVTYGNKKFMIDCGEGTQLAMRRFKISLQSVDHIFISHLHGDHYFGLIGYISTLHLLGRSKELHLYGPADLEHIINIQLDASQTFLTYPLIFHPTAGDDVSECYNDGNLSVTSFPMIHRIPTTGFIFRELHPYKHLRADVIKLLKIPFERLEGIRKGDDFTDEKGQVILNKDITLPIAEARKYVFFADTAISDKYMSLVENADLLYHEATFMESHKQAAIDKFHSTAKQAAGLALSSQAKRLVIGHFSARYKDTDGLMREAREVFENTDVAIEGMVFNL